MKIIKPLMAFISVFTIMFSMTGAVFADSSGYVTVQFDKTSAKVGDTVTLKVDVYNTGTTSWNNVIVSVPVPHGLKYLSHYTTISLSNYDPGSGLWAVNNMRHDQHGKTKTLYMTFEVLPSAEGDNVVANGRFNSITIGDPAVHFENNVSPAAPAVLHVSTESSGSGDGTGNGDGDGNGTGNGTGNGIPTIEDIIGKIVNQDTLQNQLNKLTNGSVGDQSAAQSSNPSGGKTAYDITPTPSIPVSNNTIYALLVVIGIIALILVGYFKGMRIN